MGKYDRLKTVKRTKARTAHCCHKCGGHIARGEIYYRGHIQDRFLHSLHGKKYCSPCYEEQGTILLLPRKALPRLRGPLPPGQPELPFPCPKRTGTARDA